MSNNLKLWGELTPNEVERFEKNANAIVLHDCNSGNGISIQKLVFKNEPMNLYIETDVCIDECENLQVKGMQSFIISNEQAIALKEYLNKYF